MNNRKDFDHLFPENSLSLIGQLSDHLTFRMVVKYNRSSKLGDFRQPINGSIPLITVNGDMNPYHFLITFVHEIAHLVNWNEYGRKVKAHGSEWKSMYSEMLTPFIIPEIFPDDLLPILQKHVQKPKASTYADVKLFEVLRRYNHDHERFVLLKDLEIDKPFRMENGRSFIKGQKRRSRILCRELQGRRQFLIHGYAEVFPID